jgi:hypothetical protein
MTTIDTEVEEVENMFAVSVFRLMRIIRYFHLLLI